MAKPGILIVATERWYPTVRLGMALANVGCTVAAVCPSQHPFNKTRALKQMHRYDGLRPLSSVHRAIAATRPDLVIPGDDLATHHLHDLHAEEMENNPTGTWVSALIERSLGDPKSFPIVYARSAFMQLAGEAGVRTPETAVIKNAAGLKKWESEVGFPAVLKADRTSGGDGVRVAQTLEGAERAFRELQAPPLLARALKRAFIDRDLTLVWPSLTRQKHVVNAQSFVAGHEATSAAFCWQGAVLASLHFEVLKKIDSAGHATVVCKIDNPEMASAVETIAGRLNLSGMHGFDFMLESSTGNAYLIEMNPRATQVGHLRLGDSHDLPAAIYAALSGGAIEAVAGVTENDTVALFPQEWLRDPQSAFLTSGYHDVPWEEPELVNHCVRKSQSKNGFSFRPPSQTRGSVPLPAQPSAGSQIRLDELWAGNSNEIAHR